MKIGGNSIMLMKRLIFCIILCVQFFSVESQNKNNGWRWSLVSHEEYVSLLDGNQEFSLEFTFSFENYANFVKCYNLKGPFYVNVSIWREKDVLHPANRIDGDGTNLNWNALERVMIKDDGGANAIEGKPHKHQYGFVNKEYLSFVRNNGSSFKFHLCQGIINNIPQPQNPTNQRNVIVVYYLRVDIYGDVNGRRLLYSSKTAKAARFKWEYFKEPVVTKKASLTQVKPVPIDKPLSVDGHLAFMGVSQGQPLDKVKKDLAAKGFRDGKDQWGNPTTKGTAYGAAGAIYVEDLAELGGNGIRVTMTEDKQYTLPQAKQRLNALVAAFKAQTKGKAARVQGMEPGAAGMEIVNDYGTITVTYHNADEVEGSSKYNVVQYWFDDNPEEIVKKSVLTSNESVTKIIKRPLYKTTKNNTRCLITKIECDEDMTKVYFEYSTEQFGGWVNISSNTYIVGGDGQKLKISKALGIPYAPNKQNYNTATTIEFSLVFPVLKNGTKQFDLIEPGDSDWKFYNIKISE